MSVLWGILGLGFLVFFHELGHYIAARICGVTVEAFSIGMGPVLFHKETGGTDYRISLIPLGGYCSMKGEKDFQDAIESKSSCINGAPDSFYGVHPLKRLAIAFAGPFANVLFSFLALTVVACVGYSYYSAGTKVSMADEVFEGTVSPAHIAGMQSGDEIISIDGKKTEDFSQIYEIVGSSPDKVLRIEVNRNGTTLFFDVKSELDKTSGGGKIGIVSDPDSVVKREYPPRNIFKAFAEGFSRTADILILTVKSVSTLFKGVDVTNAVSGPVRITTILGDGIKEGFSAGFREGLANTFELLSLISISLFLTNLLPVPVLDGGLILFAFIEWVSGKKLHPKFLYYIQFVGLVIVGSLVVFALAGDIFYFTGGSK